MVTRPIKKKWLWVCLSPNQSLKNIKSGGRGGVHQVNRWIPSTMFFFVGEVQQQVRQVLRVGAGRCLRCASPADLVDCDKVLKLFFVPVWRWPAKDHALYCTNCSLFFPTDFSPPSPGIADALRRCASCWSPRLPLLPLLRLFAVVFVISLAIKWMPEIWWSDSRVVAKFCLYVWNGEKNNRSCFCLQESSLTFSLFFSQVSTVLSRMSEIGMQSKLIYKESIHWQSFLLNLVHVNKQIGTTSKDLVSWKNHGCMVFFFFFTRLYNSLVFELFPLLR